LFSPTETDNPISSEFGPSALDIATGLPAIADNDTKAKEKIATEKKLLIFNISPPN
jgi:hypothetical protein